MSSNSALAAPVSGVRLLIAGASALISPKDVIPEVEFRSSQPFVIFSSFLLLAVSIGLLGAAYQEPFLATSERPLKAIPLSVSVFLFPLLVFITLYLAYYYAKLYLWIVKRVSNISDDVNLCAPSFIYTEFGVIWIFLLIGSVVLFNMQGYLGINSITYWISFPISIIIFSRVYRVSLRLQYFWTAILIASIQTGLSFLIGTL